FRPADAHCVSLPVPPTASPTFHARDLFAPAAGQLALGASLSHLGQPITDPYRSPLPVPREDGGVVVGEVLYVDRFGTLISNIPGDAVEPGVRIKVADRKSTRLNSSHVKTSYAVRRLKKKRAQ